MGIRSVKTDCVKCHAPLVVLPAETARVDVPDAPSDGYIVWADPDGEFECANPDCHAPNQVDAAVR
jgi:hypothetical protein